MSASRERTSDPDGRRPEAGTPDRHAPGIGAEGLGPEDLRRIVARDARTAQLLGVDFVPCRRAGGTEMDKNDRIAEVKPGPAERSRPMAAAGRDREAKRSALEALRERYERDAPHASFATEFTHIVFGEGDPGAEVMFVGEAPGAEEDASGRPFVGRAGKLLNKMIEAMGLSRESVYIANVLKTRPPNNRTPTADEIHACAPYLFEQIRIIGPRALVTLGAPSARLLLGADPSAAMGALRGAWASFPPDSLAYELLDGPWEGEAVPVMPTYHPAFLLRSYTTDNRAMVWSDLRQVMDRLGLEPGP